MEVLGSPSLIVHKIMVPVDVKQFEESQQGGPETRTCTTPLAVVSRSGGGGGRGRGGLRAQGLTDPENEGRWESQHTPGGSPFE